MHLDTPDPAGNGTENRPLITLIAGQPGMADQLLAAHVETRTGHCSICSAGAQSGRYRWPCAITLAARAAKTRRDAR
jgi:hypothetical protein